MARRLLFDGAATELGLLPLVAALPEITGTLDKTLGATTLTSTGSIAGAGIDGDLNKTLGAALLSSSGTLLEAITGSLDKTLGPCSLTSNGSEPPKIYQEVWIIQEQRKKKRKVKRKLKAALKAVEVAEEAVEEGAALKRQLEALEVAKRQLDVSQKALDLQQKEAILNKAVLVWEIEQQAQADARLRYQTLVQAYEDAKAKAYELETNDLMQIMAYMLQLD